MINWYPGHMFKTKKALLAQVKLVDVVLEIRDARIPLSSKNPDIEEICKNKPRIVLFNKKDLADVEKTEEILKKLPWPEGVYYCLVESKATGGLKEVWNIIEKVYGQYKEKWSGKGLRPRPLRGMVVGIPNVGKSTVINRLLKRSVKTGAKPGVTRGVQWIKLSDKLELMDTPGVLWPKLGDMEVGLKLGATGSISDEVLPVIEVANWLLKILCTYRKPEFFNRFNLNGSENLNEIYEKIGRRRGLFLRGEEIDYQKVALVILKEFRQGLLGKYTLD
ncbi:ribosome biogenesis GTPase YlqF [Carboxydothermus hydrogenoformans]|uniref:Ribosome biogenesis GTPase A n=1 Tax=Carboxydothermus hydrogenoformans (strain ATCC BAA-161 / DSM 6008 / Z-2901) TaxID=246194 RepID=Q3AC75_CARHZ|nr:ribosome biogenesis GTPase YlqF [Carboxydothermus hydrogenoformans]ABB14141.1 GTP-binding protein [Carboxydothermus hydrogenoformans Z-2901]